MDMKETKELVRFSLKLGQALQSALEDGNINLMDAIKFIPVLKDLQAAIAGAAKIPAELKDLDETELQALTEYVKEEFDIPNDELESKIEMGLDVGLHLIKLAMGFMKK
jgi:hypothetical protein